MSHLPNIYTANAWPYVRAELSKEDKRVVALARRTIELGFDGFDLMVGPDSFPELALADAMPVIQQAREAAQSAGGRIASIVLVGLGLQDMDVASDLLAAGPRLCAAAGTNMLHTLPRKVGISHEDGFTRLQHLWQTHGQGLLDAGLTVTAENHALQLSSDEDIFQIRTSSDFMRLVELTGGGMRVKYDPAWLMFGGEMEVLAPLDSLLPHLAVLDVKDFKDGRFVTPGTGVVPIRSLLERCSSSVSSISVEVEEHHFPADGHKETTDPRVIDLLQADSLRKYQEAMAS